MNGAIVISWGNPVRGREQKSLEVFTKALAYYDGLAKQGRIHGHREYFGITGNASKVGGFVLVDGNLQELLSIQTSDESLRLMADAGAIVENFTVQVYAGGTDASVQDQLVRYTEELQKLGYM